MAGAEIKTPLGTAPVVPVMIMGFGAYLTWFGVHYWRSETAWPSDPVKAVLTGKAVPAVDRAAGEAAIRSLVDSAKSAAAAGPLPVGGGALETGPTGPAAGGQVGGGGDRIAAQALRYIGAGYVFGGNASRIGLWDCSSFTSFVLGHDLGYKLPGGVWGGAGMPPHTHGPTTHSYMLFGTPVNASQAVKGDLIISSEHMGIVVGPGTYMSAKNPIAGTGLGLWNSGDFPGGTPVFRRVT